jgi:hypothetical protein
VGIREAAGAATWNASTNTNDHDMKALRIILLTSAIYGSISSQASYDKVLFNSAYFHSS